MKRKIRYIGLILAVLFMITGCTTAKAYTFDVETGDMIRVELNTTGGYDLSSEVPFTISRGDETISQGTFLTLDGYNYYIAAIESDSKAEKIESDTKGDISYTFYVYHESDDSKQYNYVIKVNGSDTGLLIANYISEESARDCFERLIISQD